MTTEEKSQRFWDLISGLQNVREKKWETLSHFKAWAEGWGGQVKTVNIRKRKGRIVRSFAVGEDRWTYDFPEEFVDQCLVLDSLP
jgi:hypothetical protein